MIFFRRYDMIVRGVIHVGPMLPKLCSSQKNFTVMKRLTDRTKPERKFERTVFLPVIDFFIARLTGQGNKAQQQYI